MQNKHGGSIRSHDCYLNYSCAKNNYVMESWVSSNCTRNIHGPCTPEKEVNRKENTMGKIAKRQQIAKVNAFLDIDVSEVLIHYVTFCDRENKNLSSRINRVSFRGISYDLLNR